MTESTYECDVAILGAGPGGYVAALRAALRGAKVCLIEKGLLGGTCLNVGCIPSKAMLHASELAYGQSDLAQFGISVGKASVDGQAVMARVTKVVAGLRKGVAGLLKARGVEVIEGVGRLVAPDAVEVQTADGATRVSAKSIIIATGSRPARPELLPWDSPRVITTDEACTAEGLPQSVIVMGGGIIGCEFATIYAELGVETTLIEMLDRLAANLDEDASRAITRSLKKRGVDVIMGAPVGKVEATDASVTASWEGGGSAAAQQMLVCVGRQPNIEDIGLEDVSVELVDGVIAVDSGCRTNVDGVYAIGDVAESRQYAHLASRMGVVAADNAAGHEAEDDRTVVPAGVYTHPQVAAVGLSEKQAREQCESVKVAKFPLAASGMAQASGQAEGAVKLIAVEPTGEILGAVIVAANATDLIQPLALAMRTGLTVAQVAETIHSHPSMAESVAEAAESWLGLPRHSLK